MKQPLIMVEDEASIRDMLRFSLEKEGYFLLEAENYYELQTLLQEFTPSLILLDWMLPDVSGLDIIRLLKEKPKTKDIPIILLTAKAEENHKVLGLQTGADDYVVKPFSPRELIARINAVLRRGALHQSNQLHINDLTLDTDTGTLTIKNTVIKLTAQEFRLLHFLLANKNRIYSRDQLLNHVWGHAKDVTDRTVDVQIRRLRQSLKKYNYDLYIKTIHGMGYKLVDDLNAETTCP